MQVLFFEDPLGFNVFKLVIEIFTKGPKITKTNGSI